MSDRAPAGSGIDAPREASEASDEHESWLREAARAPHATRLPRPGSVIGGKYRIEDLLGRGGMGVVFRARHLVSERPVAIKWMLRSAADEQTRKRFEREARAAGRIEHPNVVSLFDIGTEDDCSYLVMELLRGESLRARLGRGRLAPTEAVDVLLPAMRGVAAAHRAGVVHRDLKPDNIFLCEPAEGGPAIAKVLDFGISSIASMEAADSTLTQEGTLLGSLAYMSPEQLRSPHDVDARADVYAFGVILYELLSGTPPFAGATHSALIVAIATMEPKPLSRVLPSVPSGLEEAVFRALARDPAARFQDVAALIDALSPFASASAGGARASGVTTLAHGPRTLPTSAAEVPDPASASPVTSGAPPTSRAFPRVAMAAAAAIVAIALWAWLRDTPTLELPVEQAGLQPMPPITSTPPAALPHAEVAPEEVPTAPAPPAPAPVPPPPAAASAVNEVAPAAAPAPARLRVSPRQTPEKPKRAAASTKANEDALFSGRK